MVVVVVVRMMMNDTRFDKIVSLAVVGRCMIVWMRRL